MLKFSCADFTFPVVDRLTALKLINLLGFNSVDIGLFARSSHFSPLLLSSAPEEYTHQVRNNLDAASLSASDVFLQIGDDPSDNAVNDPAISVRAENRKIFQQAITFTQALSCKHMTGLPGVFHANSDRQRDLSLAIEETLWRVEQCRNAGITYSIEPHVGSICANVAAAKYFVTAVPSLTLTLDYGHFIMAGESSGDVHPLIPYTSHIHVRGGAPGRLQTPLSENTIDFTTMLQELRRIRYDGFLALEYVWIDWNECNRTDNVSETIQLRKALENSLLSFGEQA